MTETSLLATMTHPCDEKRSYKHAYESIGRPIPFLECKIVDPKTKEILPLNTNGEVHLRGFNILRSYWNDQKKTDEAIDKNGWLSTGDICSMDEDGYLYFKSRSKVSPASIESSN
jgi:fatty-acyl-CoA synthase